MDGFHDGDYVNSTSSANETFEKDTQIDPAIYLRVLSVLMIRAGLFISEIISIPSSNIQVLVLHNMIDLSVTFVGYGLAGYVLAFGKDFKSIIGISGFISEDSNFNEFIQGWSVLAVVSGLQTAAVGDRVSFFAGLVLNLLLSVVSFPILFHWVLHRRGWMRAMKFMGVSVSYKDYSHSSLIHMSGGFVSFLGMLVLNKRMLRFKDLDSSSIPDIGPSLSFFGYFLTLLGFVGLTFPTRKYFQSHMFYNFYGIIVVNVLSSVVGTIVTTLFLTFFCTCRDRDSKWANLRFAQGGISGVAVVAGGVDVYHPLAALGTGLVNGLVFFTESHIMSKTNLEDFCNISAVHFFSGFLGTLLPPILGIREGFGTVPYNNFLHFSWQLLCDATILALLGAIFYPVLVIFDRCRLLRTWEEEVNHKRALSAMKMVPKIAVAKRLFVWADTDLDTQNQDHKSRSNKGSREKSGRVNILFQKNMPVTGLDEPGSRKANFSETKTMMPFYEEVDSESGKTATKDGSATMKMMKSIRNISDSKLIGKLKDGVGKPRRTRAESSDAGVDHNLHTLT
ncbi:UNVERIFIED_CONTAM: hypothetical protein PYX00_002466 [Menopon gallinae]|uniref:Ammonium transporter AmtB-like domain-containing protein n=1 Tax=Menopon gallinae TaxID=328185 RepID=A0AAW2IH49_9NEOP